MEGALLQADALAGQAVREAEARCRVLGQFINDLERAGSRTSDWSDVLGELSSLHRYRSGLLRTRDLIRQALDYPVGECPARVSLPAVSSRPEDRTQVQVQVQRRHRK